MLLEKNGELTRASFYEAGVERPPACPSLTEAIAADVCVIGAGYAGLSAALELALRGYSVVLIEARRIGWGASGRNGGQALIGFGSAAEHAIETQLPAADACRAWNMSLEGLQLLQERIANYAIDCDYSPGYLSLAVNARKARALDAWVRHVADFYGYEMQSIPPAEIGNWIASTRFHAGVFDPHSGHLHPLKYCLGLAAAARSSGVRIFEDSPVRRLERGDRPSVKTATGEVNCRFAVLAGNVYLDEYGTDRKSIAPELTPRIMPVGTYLIATDNMPPERADALIRQRAAVSDTNHILDYFRLTADHRLLFGAGESYNAATPRNLAGKIRQRMLTVFPQLADLSVPYVWGGFVDMTMNRAPDFGRLGKNIYYLQGFSGHGVVLAGMAGKLVAETIAGQAERFDLLARIKHHPFPGGALLRTPALVLAMLYYRLRDLF
jgi:gamma-glutamylputrescine oxidase